MQRIHFWYGLAGCFLAALCGCRAASAPPPAELPPLNVPVATPVERTITDFEEYTGKIMSVERVNVMARADGYLSDIRFQPGGLVKKGDVLFVIDPRPYRASLDIAKGQLLQAQVRVDRLTKEHDRIEKLFRTGAGTAEDFDKIKGDLAEAKAAVAVAKGNVEQANLNLEFTEVKAPIDGRVGRQMVTVGNLVQGTMAAQATVLTDLVSVDRVYVYFDAPERDVLRYRRLRMNGKQIPDDRAALEVEVGLFDEVGWPHKATVDYAAERIDPGTGTQSFRAVLANPKDSLLTEGMFARVRVAFSDPYPGLVVADRAIVTIQGNKFLFVVNDQDTVEERQVELGRIVAPGMRHIKAGLRPNDRIAVANLQMLMAGAKVVPALGPMPTPPGK
jgi:RND family efflux transporter MFP subunit